MNNVVRSLDIHSKTNRRGGKNDHVEALLTLEVINERLPGWPFTAGWIGVAIDDRDVQSEAIQDHQLESALNVTQFCKNDDFLTAIPDFFKGLFQPAHFG